MTIDVVEKVQIMTTVWIQKWIIDGEPRYDWSSIGGRSSDELFDTPEDAKQDALDTIQ